MNRIEALGAGVKKRLWRSLDEASPLERDLCAELLDAERVRAKVMAGVFAVVCLASSIATLTVYVGLVPVFAGLSVPPTLPLAAFALLFVLYELLVLRLLAVVERRRVLLPDPPRYGNSFAEVTFISILVVVLVRSYGVVAFQSPAVFVYAIPILLSTLRLRFGLGAFTGILAGAEYALLSTVFLPSEPGALGGTAPAQWLGMNLGRSALLATTGVVAGIVALQVKKRIDTTVAALGDRARILGTFGQYISPAVAEKLLERDANVGTELRSVTVMFLDIRGFTKFAEKKSPAEVVAYLDHLFGFMIESVNRHSGMINKFLGDGFMALFGAPFSDGSDSLHAADAAREIVAELAAQTARGEIPPTRIGIGIHTGPAVVGSIGSSQRKEFTAIGDTVNLASRVEQLTKELDSCVLVTEAVYREVEAQHPGKELPAVKVKGRDEDVRLYKLA